MDENNKLNSPGPSGQEKKKDTVEVDKATLEAILKNQEEQSAQLEKLTRDNRKLLEVADKGRLEQWDRLNASGELIRRAGLRLWDGKVIVAWKMIKNDVMYVNGVEHADQVVRIFIENGKEKPTERDVSLLQFERSYRLQTGDIVRQSKTPHGETWTIKFDDGREFEVDKTFVN